MLRRRGDRYRRDGGEHVLAEKDQLVRFSGKDHLATVVRFSGGRSACPFYRGRSQTVMVRGKASSFHVSWRPGLKVHEDRDLRAG